MVSDKESRGRRQVSEGQQGGFRPLRIHVEESSCSLRFSGAAEVTAMGDDLPSTGKPAAGLV